LDLPQIYVSTTTPQAKPWIYASFMFFQLKEREFKE
jgi:hypothetical protein